MWAKIGTIIRPPELPAKKANVLWRAESLGLVHGGYVLENTLYQLEQARLCCSNIQPHSSNGLSPPRLASCSCYVSTLGQLPLSAVLTRGPIDEAASFWNFASCRRERHMASQA